MSNFTIANKIELANPHANLDVLYGPYNRLAEAKATVVSVLREKGLTVGVYEGGAVVEYWWKAGTTDGDLVLKQASVAGDTVIADLSTRIDTVEAIAKGANQAKSYLTYSAFVTAIKAAAGTTYKTGQGFYIGTVGVPDLWVYSVETSFVNYTYTSDQDLINAISTNTTQQIGYFKIAFLETQKVDLSNYYTKSQIDTLVAGKQAQLNGTGIVTMAGTHVYYDNSTYVPVIPLGSVSDYQHSVILMFKDADITFHRIDGTLYSMFPEGVGQERYNAAELAIHYARWNSSNNDKSFSVINKGSIFNFELVTCTYNSELWWGLIVTSSQAMTFYFKGTTNGISWNVVPYYNSNTSTVLNAEINSSISFQNSVLTIPKLGSTPFIIPNPSTGITAIPYAMTVGGNVTVTGVVTAPTFSGALTGNAATASKLAIARTLKLGLTGKTFDGSANVAWTLDEIGALALTGGTMTGLLDTYYRKTGLFREKYLGQFSFANGTANQKIDIEYSGGLHGWIEIEIAGSWSYGNAMGKLVKRMNLISNTTTINAQKTYYVEADPAISSHIAISDVIYDSTKGKYVIKIACISNLNNTYTILMRTNGGLNNDIVTSATLSSIYTTDTTVYSTPKKTLPAGTTVDGDFIVNGNINGTVAYARQANADILGRTIHQTYALKDSGITPPVNETVDLNNNTPTYTVTDATAPLLSVTNAADAGGEVILPINLTADKSISIQIFRNDTIINGVTYSDGSTVFASFEYDTTSWYITDTEIPEIPDYSDMTVDAMIENPTIRTKPGYIRITGYVWTEGTKVFLRTTNTPTPIGIYQCVGGDLNTYSNLVMIAAGTALHTVRVKDGDVWYSQYDGKNLNSITFVRIGSAETGQTIRTKLEALTGDDKLQYSALRNITGSYTLDFRDDVSQIQDINIEGLIRIDEIQTINVATLQLGALTIALPLEAPITVEKGAYNVWTITRNTATAASVGIKYTKL